MKEIEYVLRPKGIAVEVADGENRDSPDFGSRIVGFHLTAEKGGKLIGGHNIQAAVGPPDRKRYRHDEAPALWLASGWWVSLRNEFARAPDVALQIMASAETELAEVTRQLDTARGENAKRIFVEMCFRAVGPDYWR